MFDRRETNNRMTQPGNIFSSLPHSSNEEVFEVLHKQPGITIERIVSHGHRTPAGEWYDQQTDEWVIMIQGKGTVLLEDGNEHRLNRGDYLFIPKHQKHRVTYTELQTIWLAIHINDR